MSNRFQILSCVIVALNICTNFFRLFVLLGCQNTYIHSSIKFFLVVCRYCVPYIFCLHIRMNLQGNFKVIYPLRITIWQYGHTNSLEMGIFGFVAVIQFAPSTKTAVSVYNDTILRTNKRFGLLEFIVVLKCFQQIFFVYQ